MSSELKFNEEKYEATKLHFDEEAHQYTVKNKKLLSVTQLLDLIRNPFDSDSIIDKMMKGQEIYLGSKKELIGMTKGEIKELWEVNGRAKSRYGSYIHDLAEKIALGEDVPLDRPELKQAKKFFEKEGYTLVEAEKQVFSEELGIAGTMDLLLEKDGLYYIGDWKTNLGKDLSDWEGDKWTENLCYPLNNVPDLHYWIYALQFSIYRYMIERKQPELKFGGQFLIHLQESQVNCPYKEMKQITYKKVDTPYMEQEVKTLLDWYNESKGL